MWHSGKKLACQCRRHKRCRFNPWSDKICGEGNGNPLRYFCLENSMDRWALVGYNPWGCKESDTTEHIHSVKWAENTIFLKRSLVFPILLFSSISLHWSLRKAFLSLLAILWNSAFKWIYLSFSPLLFASLLFTAICKASSDSHFAFLHFFSMQ